MLAYWSASITGEQDSRAISQAAGTCRSSKTSLPRRMNHALKYRVISKGSTKMRKVVWPAWSYMLLAFVGTWSPSIRDKMVRVTHMAATIRMSNLNAMERQETRLLSFVLSQVLIGNALLIVMNVAATEPENGFEAWRMLARQCGNAYGRQTRYHTSIVCRAW